MQKQPSAGEAPCYDQTNPPSSQRESWFSRLLDTAEAFLQDVNCLHVAFKLVAYTALALYLWLGWRLLPIGDHWSLNVQSERLPFHQQDLFNYFADFAGYTECNIRATNLYFSPPQKEGLSAPQPVFCKDKNTLLQALSNGGRIGFDAPYVARNCQYRWFTVPEICFILDRFDRIIFVGDSSLQAIYAGLNILLHEDLAAGALNVPSMEGDEKHTCHCENQFTKQSCWSRHLVSSDQANLIHKRRLCRNHRHDFLKLTDASPSDELISKFKGLVPRAPRSNYKPIPVIHSLSPSDFSHNDAQASLLKYLQLVDQSARNTPMLWIGPTAAGHLEIKGRKSNQEIWDFDRVLAHAAQQNDIDVLGMWNLTVQASSWDGMRFGEEVAITQAMMLINWLSRLESS